jgi:hypothetical protein
MPGFGPASASVASFGVLGFLEAPSSNEIGYNGRNTLNRNRRRTFETQLAHSVKVRSDASTRLGLRTVVDYPDWEVSTSLMCCLRTPRQP